MPISGSPSKIGQTSSYGEAETRGGDYCMSSSEESAKTLAIFAGIDPAQRRSAMTVIRRREGLPDLVQHYRIDSIAKAAEFADVLAAERERNPKAPIYIAIEYPLGSFGHFRHGTAIVRAAASVFEKELARYRLKSKVTRVPPSVWHTNLGVKAMRVAPIVKMTKNGSELRDSTGRPVEDKEAMAKERSRLFAKTYVCDPVSDVTGASDLSQDEYDSACLAEYARRVLSKRP